MAMSVEEFLRGEGIVIVHVTCAVCNQSITDKTGETYRISGDEVHEDCYYSELGKVIEGLQPMIAGHEKEREKEREQINEGSSHYPI